MKKSLKLFAVLIFAWIFLSNFASAFLISDQGTDVKDVTTGDLILLANLTVLIYDNLTNGNLIFGQNFTDAIVNGSWNIMTNPSLEYGKSYYKDYQINGEDLDFDGKERLEFQSSVGEINNVSFINFSLISSCSAGSSIRLIYENGSVVCEVDDGIVSSDLTNYALKNQSETFAGNITTSETGFFGFLGSLISRITGLFVQDIDFNGTINGSGNITTTGNISADYLRGDGSLLTNLPGGDNSSWNQTHANTLFYLISNPSTFWNATFALFNKTYADTLYADISVTGDNSSWNQTHANTLYLNKSGTNADQDVDISPYNFQAGNLTLTKKITFSLGEIIDNIVDGWVKVTGSLNITGDIEFNGEINGSGNITTIGNITTTSNFCFTANCSAKMYHNGTGLIITS